MFGSWWTWGYKKLMCRCLPLSFFLVSFVHVVSFSFFLVFLLFIISFSSSSFKYISLLAFVSERHRAGKLGLRWATFLGESMIQLS